MLSCHILKLVNTPIAHLTVKAQACSKRAGCGARVLEKFKKVVLEIAMQHPDATKKKEPILLFQDFGDSSLDFTIIVFTENAFKGAMIKSDIRFAIEKALKRNGIEIPFPQRVIHTPK